MCEAVVGAGTDPVLGFDCVHCHGIVVSGRICCMGGRGGNAGGGRRRFPAKILLQAGSMIDYRSTAAL